MLDPYYRVTLEQKDKITPTYSVKFQAPEKTGVYKMKVVYKRFGWSYIDHDTMVVIRQYKHNEFERFLPVAYPYYTSVLAAMAGFFVFTMLFLFSKFK
jgi:oligosaccharyltransferase complex subunit beta